MSTSPNRHLLERIRAEYIEMPGMKLTVSQVQRLCGVERTTCKMVLDELVDAKFLCVNSHGAYARLMDRDISHPRPAKADLEPKNMMPMSRPMRG